MFINFQEQCNEDEACFFYEYQDDSSVCTLRKDGTLPDFNRYGCALTAGPISAKDTDSCAEDGGNSTCTLAIKKIWNQMVYDWKDLVKILTKMF